MLAVGDVAPEFRLPSAQGAEVSLAEYRGRKNVIVWFTKGMGCVFCRQHMSQLARSAGELATRSTEVLQVVPSTVARARSYAAKYRLPFPYLCDTEEVVRRAWRLEVRSHGPLWYAATLVRALRTPKPDNDFSLDLPAPSEVAVAMRDEDTGFFVVDRGGVIRYAYGGSYMTGGGPTENARPLPNTDELLRALDRCAA
jgi:peroxiredoxin